jgi:hypothetical protein
LKMSFIFPISNWRTNLVGPKTMHKYQTSEFLISYKDCCT